MLASASNVNVMFVREISFLLANKTVYSARLDFFVIRSIVTQVKQAAVVDTFLFFVIPNGWF